MTIILFIVGIIAALACAALGIRCMRIALNLFPVVIGASYAAYLILGGHITWAIIAIIISLYATCPWWEFLDEKLWMRIGVCHGF
jgi:O-antigen ligase